MSRPPTAAIVIPVYNGSRYLRHALESALEQRRDCDADVEIVVVDNGSTDDTPQVAAEFEARTFRYVRYESTVPMGASWNRALHHASAEYIVLLHADDMLEPCMLARALALLEQEPRMGYCFGACWFIDEHGARTGMSRPYERSRVFEARDFFRQHVRANFIYCPTVVMRWEACPSAGAPFRSDLRQVLDWDVWLRIELAGWKVGYISEFQALYRMHHQSASSEIADSLIGYEEVTNVLQTLPGGRELPVWARPSVGVELSRLAGQVAFKTLRGEFREPSEKGWALAGRALAISRNRLGWMSYVRFVRELAGLWLMALRLAVRSRWNSQLRATRTTP
ncbi:MAG: glycosyltransferase family 2 protein [Gemmatimonadetes bacterium]|nr:glycosyltransferase family 2 protein [Gemmatimonadota bacterium]